MEEWAPASGTELEFLDHYSVHPEGAAAEDRSKVDLTGRDVTVKVELHAGTAAATIWTNDLSHGYVHENSAYST